MTRLVRCGLVVAASVVACGDSSSKAPAPKPPDRFPLVAARAALHTRHFHEAERTLAPRPPEGLFIKTRYRAGRHALVAYETPPRSDGSKRPAVIWIAGGFDWGIGESAWTLGSVDNDQSAAALRPEGIVLMLPSLRGTNENPGRPECFLGEVDDILSAATHLARRPDVDPERIYLGGHSTGGTLALLAAASTDRFRAVFAFGPVADPRDYGEDGCLPAGLDPAEYRPRVPFYWMHSITTPTFVIEGIDGNSDSLLSLRGVASKSTQILIVPGADHFSVLRPASEIIAQQILRDTGVGPSKIALDAAALGAAVATALETLEEEP